MRCARRATGSWPLVGCGRGADDCAMGSDVHNIHPIHPFLVMPNRPARPRSGPELLSNFVTYESIDAADEPCEFPSYRIRTMPLPNTAWLFVAQHSNTRA